VEFKIKPVLNETGFCYNKDMEKKKNVLKKEIKTKEESTYLSYDVKTIITVFLLVMVYPVGLVLMFMWMKWNKWIKFLIVLPGVLALIIPFFVLTLIGLVVVRTGGDFVKSSEFREMRREMMKRYVEEVRPTEEEISPTIKIMPLNR